MPDEVFSRVQAKRGARGGAVGGKAIPERGLRLTQRNPTLSDAAVAQILGVSRRTAYNWRNRRS